MNAKRLALIAAALLPVAVSAQEATPEPVASAPQLSRAEVRAVLDHARSNGGMKVFRAGYLGEVAKSRSRADVVAELRQAQASGEWATLNAEAPQFGAPAAAVAPRWLAMRQAR